MEAAAMYAAIQSLNQQRDGNTVAAVPISHNDKAVNK